MFHNAEVLQHRTLLKEAEEEYTKLIRYFQAQMRDKHRSDYERQTIMEFVSKIAQRIQSIRRQQQQQEQQQNNCAPSLHFTSSPSNPLISPSSTNITALPKNTLNILSNNSKTNLINNNLTAKSDKTRVERNKSQELSRNTREHISLLSDQTHQQKQKQTFGTPSSTSSPLPTPTLLPLEQVKNTNKTGTESESLWTNSDGQTLHSHLKGKALPLPPSIINALDQAQRLASQREYKYALDIVQRACEVEKSKLIAQSKCNVKSNNTPPSSSVAITAVSKLSSAAAAFVIREVERTLSECRRTYYQHCPAHFIQDNPVTVEEWKILREGDVLDTITVPI